MDFRDAELAGAAFQRVRASRGQQGHRHAHLLRQLGAEAIADMELLDLPMLSCVDDPAIGPDTVDVRDDEADGQCGGKHEFEG